MSSVALDAAPDVVDVTAVQGHDEDGDGVPDAKDDCPETPDSRQLDSDVDLVGDACDREPMVDHQHRVLFTPLTDAGSNPLIPVRGTWTQTADALHIDATKDAFVGQLNINIAQADISFGLDVRSINTSTPVQIAASVRDSSSRYYYGELYQEQGSPKLFAALNYIGPDGHLTQLPSPHEYTRGIHPGTVTFHLRTFLQPTPRWEMTAGWEEERYLIGADTASYTGGTSIQIHLDGVVVDLNYVVVIASS